MLILAFDTSTSKGGVALLKDGTVLKRLVWDREVSHGELLTPALQKCLDDCFIAPNELDALAIGNGPGSFTGVRIAVNAARSLAYALSKPVFVFDTTEILAAAVQRVDLPVAVLVNAHKNLVYATTFAHDSATGNWNRVLPLEAMSLEAVADAIKTPHVCVGDGFVEYRDVLPSALLSRLIRDESLSDEPSPEILGQLAEKRSTERRAMVWKEVQALYIRSSGAEEKLRGN